MVLADPFFLPWHLLVSLSRLCPILIPLMLVHLNLCLQAFIGSVQTLVCQEEAKGGWEW